MVGISVPGRQPRLRVRLRLLLSIGSEFMALWESRFAASWPALNVLLGIRRASRRAGVERNSRTYGYQGLSVRSIIQRQSVDLHKPKPRPARPGRRPGEPGRSRT